MVLTRVNGIGIWDRILATLSNIAILSNALIIAFSSDFLDKLFYVLETGSIEGFTDDNLLYSNLGGLNGTCRYFESKYHGEISTETARFYKQIALKLVFVIVYQNVAVWIQKCIELSVPDIPRNLDIKLKKERYQIKEKLNLTESRNQMVFNVLKESQEMKI